MKESLHLKLEKLLERQEELEGLLADPETINNQNKFKELSQEYAEIKPIVSCFEKYIEVAKQIENSREMLKENDKEIQQLAIEELKKIELVAEELQNKLQLLLLPKDPNDKSNLFIEIRAGTGGEEAALFAGDLMRMYVRYAEIRKWEIEYISVSESDLEGYKEVIMRVIGDGAYSRLKFESGAHRVQRVPETESQGRIHTSTSTVAILPKVDDIKESEINQSEIRIDTFRASGPGGQSVNTTDSAVRITHIPTGIVVSQQDEKSQHKNKAKALSILSSKIHDFEKQKLESERASKRKNMVGTGDRSEKIRTYNYPQGRVTEHRIKLTVHNLESVIDGQLNEIVDSLITQSNAEKLLEIEEQSQ